MAILQIKNHGGSLVLVLPKEFLNFRNFKKGDWVNVDDIIKVKKPKEINNDTSK